jgi:hypothetical protein
VLVITGVLVLVQVVLPVQGSAGAYFSAGMLVLVLVLSDADAGGTGGSSDAS